MHTGKQRLDARVLAEGLAQTRSEAQALIRLGRVLADDAPAEKPGALIPPQTKLRLRGKVRRFVSRGGEKLAGALAAFNINVAGANCLDLGASTGGFTDCLLQNGARAVCAVDVGYGQLAAKLRAHPKVHVLERCNARHLQRAQLPAGFCADWATLDLSFISAAKILPRLPEVAPAAQALVLVKPQFELAREQVGKGGVVRAPELRAAAVQKISAAAANLGYAEVARAESVLAGPAGNRETFLHLRPR